MGAWAKWLNTRWLLLSSTSNLVAVDCNHSFVHSFPFVCLQAIHHRSRPPPIESGPTSFVSHPSRWHSLISKFECGNWQVFHNFKNHFLCSTGTVIYCTANGNPTPKISWETIKNDQLVSDAKGREPSLVDTWYDCNHYPTCWDPMNMF